MSNNSDSSPSGRDCIAWTHCGVCSTQAGASGSGSGLGSAFPAVKRGFALGRRVRRGPIPACARLRRRVRVRLRASFGFVVVTSSGTGSTLRVNLSRLNLCFARIPGNSAGKSQQNLWGPLFAGFAELCVDQSFPSGPRISCAIRLLEFAPLCCQTLECTHVAVTAPGFKEGSFKEGSSKTIISCGVGVFKNSLDCELGLGFEDQRRCLGLLPNDRRARRSIFSSFRACSSESSGSGCAALICSALSAWMDLRNTVT